MRQMEESAKEVTDQFLNTSSVGMMFVNLFVIALLPAVGEEMMFRGWLQRVLGKSVNYHTAFRLKMLKISFLKENKHELMN